MAVPTVEDIRTWTEDERAQVARALDATADRPMPEGRVRRTRLAVLGVTIGGAALLIPWAVYLSLTLPRTQDGGAWRLAWVGFDIALAAALAATGWLAWRRRQVVVVGLVVSATLVLVDAWFDVCLSWGTSEQGGALVSALFIEIPVAVLLSRAALVVTSRTARVVASLRGQEVNAASLWTAPLVMLPPRHR